MGQGFGLLPLRLAALSIGASVIALSAAPASTVAVAAVSDPAAATNPAVLPRPRPSGGPPAASEPQTTALPADGSLTAVEVDRLRASLRWAAEQGFIGGGKEAADHPEAAPLPADAAPPVPPTNLTNVQQRPTTPALVPDAIAVEAPDASSGGAADAPVCAGPPGTPLVDWGPDRPAPDGFLAGIARLRVRFADREDRNALRDLAHFYLGEGFPQEALAALAATGTAPRPLLDAVRLLLDRADRTSDTLPEQVACHSDAAVWRAAWFAAHGAPQEALKATDEALAPLATFPKHPRTVMALVLAGIAIDHDDTGLAKRLLALVDPAPGQHVEGQVTFTRGRIALAQGHPTRADWFFKQALAAGGEAARQVRLFQIRHALANGMPPPDWSSAVMQSVLFAYRGDRRLLPAALLAADVYAAEGHQARALEVLGDAAERLPPAISLAPIVAKARAILAAAFADPSAMGDAEALQLFADVGHFLADDPAGVAVRTTLARRMLAAGLPSAALRIVSPLTGEAVTPAVRQMKAEARHRAGHPAAALDELRAAPALSGPTADTLKRHALARLGRYAAAAEAAKPDAAPLRWASADWSAAAADYAGTLPAQAPKRVGEAEGEAAIRALAAAYMSPAPSLTPDARDRAVATAKAAGLGDAAAALTATPLPRGMTLPDAITATLERSKQVRALFPKPLPGPAAGTSPSPGS